MSNNLVKKVESHNDYLINTRRYLHQYPELSGKEFATAEFLKREIEELGLPIEQVSTTGFIATLNTDRPGKTIALRTDIDGLPIHESEMNLHQKKLCISKNSGIAHMCGHDGHMAILLTTMKILNEIKEQLSGKIIFIFEEGEETSCGILKMIDFLSHRSIDAIYGTHLTSFMDSGKICLDGGPRMSGGAVIDMRVCGKSGHGSRPDLSINPVFAAAQVLTGIASAWNNQLDVTKRVTLGITQIHGGSANNVIPETVSISGSLRFFDLSEGQKALALIKKVSSLTAQAHNCTMVFNDTMKVTLSPVINDIYLSEIAKHAVKKEMPDALVSNMVWFASESFSHYRKIAPSIFSFVGIKNETLGSGAEHHNEKFDIDESALQKAVVATTQFTIDFLNS